MFNVPVQEKTKGLCKYQILDGKHFVALGKHGIYCRRPPKSHKILKYKMMMMIHTQNNPNTKTSEWSILSSSTDYMSSIQNQDQDLEFICCIFHIIVVNNTFSGWMCMCFTVQHRCKCVQLFMWHAIIVFQSASSITSAIQRPSTNTKPRNPLKLQIGEAPPHHRDLCPSLS